MGLLDIVPAGVVTGDNLRKLFSYGIVYTAPLYFYVCWFATRPAREHNFAIPAINCTSTRYVCSWHVQVKR